MESDEPLLQSSSPSALTLSSCKDSDGVDEPADLFEDCSSSSETKGEQSLLPEEHGGLSPFHNGGLSPSHDWQLGANVGRWIGRGAPLNVQAQVLLANIVFNVTELPNHILKEVHAALRIDHAANRLGYAMQVASRLLGMSAATVCRMYRWLQQNSWAPQPPEATKCDSNDASGTCASETRHS